MTRTKKPSLRKLLLGLDAEAGKEVIAGHQVMRIHDHYFFTDAKDFDKPYTLEHAIRRLEGRDGI